VWVEVWVWSVAKSINKLSALAVANAKTPGLYGDGGGLYLQVTASGTKSWLFRYKVAGRGRYMGLGSVAIVSLAEARAAASECRRLRLQGIDPIDHRNGVRAAARLDAAKAMTFDDCRNAYIAAHGAGWRNAKHRAQWINTLSTYVSPVFAKLPVQSIDVALVTKVLEPIWATKPETASRLRGRIERILDWAKARGFRCGENPARWRGHLDHLLPARSKVRKVQHHAALRFGEIAAFMTTLRERDGVAARALEFVILTAARTGEALGATWNEIDLRTCSWTIPAHRMKGHREHRVPLSDDAIRVLERMQAMRSGKLVFPGHQQSRPLSNMALLMVLRRMGRGDLTTHGFRSSFRTWAAERTGFPREVVEAALAHVIGDKVEAAYQRGDLFDKRRRLMDEWACYLRGDVRESGLPPPSGASTGQGQTAEIHEVRGASIATLRLQRRADGRHRSEDEDCSY
jgi:integrase